MYYADKFKDAIRDESYIGNKVYYDAMIANRDGVRVILFREPWHTKDDMAKAKRDIRSERDVVDIVVKKVINCFKGDDTNEQRRKETDTN